MVISNNPLANTSDIQALINNASYTNNHTIELPYGFIPVTTLYFFHHETLNPDFNPNAKQGHIRLVGQGTLDISLAKNGKYEAGTTLYSINESSPGFVVARESVGHNNNPFKVRAFSLENITLVGKNNGFVLEAVGCPEIYLNNCKIVQENKEGSGVNIKSSWLGRIERTTILGNGSSGSALEFGSSNWGGLFEISNTSFFAFFDTGIHYAGPTSFSNFNITNSAIQDCPTGIKATASLISMNLTNAHFERSDNEILATAPIQSLRINGYYSTGRKNNPNTNIVLSGGVRQANINSVVLARGSANFVEARSHGSLRNCKVKIDSVNHWNDDSNSLTKNIVSISSNGNGEARLYINTHNYIDGRKVEIRNVPGLNGIHPIQVIDENTIDLIGSTAPTGEYNGLGVATLLCYIFKPLDGSIQHSIDGFTGEEKPGHSHIKGVDV